MKAGMSIDSTKNRWAWAFAEQTQVTWPLVPEAISIPLILSRRTKCLPLTIHHGSG